MYTLRVIVGPKHPENKELNFRRLVEAKAATVEQAAKFPAGTIILSTRKGIISAWDSRKQAWVFSDPTV